MLNNIKGGDRIRIYSPIKPMRNIWINEGHDTDLDGVPNYRDCQPFNPKRQHISKTMKKRLIEFPIWITDKPLIFGEEPDVSYPIESKKARRYAPKARKMVRGMIKKYPSVVGEIERTKPVSVTFSSVPVEKKEAVGWEYKGHVYARPIGPSILESLSEAEKILKEEIPFFDELPLQKKKALMKELKRGYPKILKESEMPELEKETIRELARTFFHELTHAKQYQKVGDKRMLAQKAMSYKIRPSEIEARRYAKKKLKEREKIGVRLSGKEIAKTLQFRKR